MPGNSKQHMRTKRLCSEARCKKALLTPLGTLAGMQNFIPIAIGTLIQTKHRYASTWNNFGPHKINGRIISVAFHPTDTNICCAASGGLWKTINYGKRLSQIFFSGAIAIIKSLNKIFNCYGEEGYSLNLAGTGIRCGVDWGQTSHRSTTSLSQGFREWILSGTKKTYKFVLLRLVFIFSKHRFYVLVECLPEYMNLIVDTL